MRCSDSESSLALITSNDLHLASGSATHISGSKSMRSKVVYSVLLLLLANAVSAQFFPGARSAGDPYLPAIGNGGYDVQHYDLTINYNPVSNTMVSRADITIRATQGLSEFSLDLRGFGDATVSIDGVAAGVVRAGDKLIVTPTVGIASNRVFHAVVNYSGT